MKSNPIIQIKKTPNCYNDYRPLRKEIYLFLLCSIIFIPLIVIIFTQLQPNIEKVYIVTIDDTFTINSFNITYYNTDINNESNIELTQNDFGSKYRINSISFGFNTFQKNYSTLQYEQALLYQQSDSTELNNLIRYGSYNIRTFDISQLTTIMEIQQFLINFKFPTNFNLFYIAINIEGITIEFQQSFYSFIEKPNSNGQNNQIDITLSQLQFNSMYYITPMNITPYQITYSIVYSSYSRYLFDFSFR